MVKNKANVMACTTKCKRSITDNQTVETRLSKYFDLDFVVSCYFAEPNPSLNYSTDFPWFHLSKLYD